MLVIFPYMCLHRTYDGPKERVHPGVLSLQPVERHLWTLTHGISKRIGSLDFLIRSWVSFPVSLGWGTQLVGLSGMRDRTSPLAAL